MRRGMRRQPRSLKPDLWDNHYFDAAGTAPVGFYFFIQQ